MQGTVHLQMPRLAPICRKLGVDYAAAMTGFDIKGGRSVPIIDGVVVCKEVEASVLEAYLEEERYGGLEACLPFLKTSPDPVFM